MKFLIAGASGVTGYGATQVLEHAPSRRNHFVALLQRPEQGHSFAGGSAGS